MSQHKKFIWLKTVLDHAVFTTHEDEEDEVVETMIQSFNPKEIIYTIKYK